MTAVVGESNDGTSTISAVNASQRDDAGPGVFARSRAAGVIGESSTSIGVLGKSEKAFGVNGKGLNDASGIGGETDRGPGTIGTTATGFAGVFGHTKGSENAVRGDHQGAGIGFFGSTVRGIAAVFGQTSAANGAAIRGQHDAGGPRLFRISEVGPTGSLTLTTGAAFTRGNVLGDGAGIYNGLNGTLTVTGVTGSPLFITANSARRGAGISAVNATATALTQTAVTNTPRAAASGHRRRHLPPRRTMTTTNAPITANTPNKCVGSAPARCRTTPGERLRW